MLQLLAHVCSGCYRPGRNAWISPQQLQQQLLLKGQSTKLGYSFARDGPVLVNPPTDTSAIHQAYGQAAQRCTKCPHVLLAWLRFLLARLVDMLSVLLLALLWVGLGWLCDSPAAAILDSLKQGDDRQFRKESKFRATVLPPAMAQSLKHSLSMWKPSMRRTATAARKREEAVAAAAAVSSAPSFAASVGAPSVAASSVGDADTLEDDCGGSHSPTKSGRTQPGLLARVLGGSRTPSVASSVASDDEGVQSDGEGPSDLAFLEGMTEGEKEGEASLHKSRKSGSGSGHSPKQQQQQQKAAATDAAAATAPAAGGFASVVGALLGRRHPSNISRAESSFSSFADAAAEPADAAGPFHSQPNLSSPKSSFTASWDSKQLAARAKSTPGAAAAAAGGAAHRHAQLNEHNPVHGLHHPLPAARGLAQLRQQRQSFVQRVGSAGGSFLQRSSSILQRSGSALQQANSNFYALNQQLSTQWSLAIKLVNALPHNLGESPSSAAAAGSAAAAAASGAGPGQPDAAGVAAKAAARKHAAKKAALLLLAVRHLACLVQVSLVNAHHF